MGSALEPPEGFAAEGRGHPKLRHARTDDCHAAAAAEPPHGLALGFCASETLGFLKESRLLEAVGCLGSLDAAWGCSLLCGIHRVPSEIRELVSTEADLRGADASYRKTDNVLNWSSVLFPSRLSDVATNY